MGPSVKRLVCSASLALATGCSHAALPSVPPASTFDVRVRTHQAQGTALLVPLYVYPGRIWTQTIAAKTRYPSVQIYIIANVNNGPGNSVDPKYVSFIAAAQKAGIDVLGYVYTQYGKRSATQVDADIAKWQAYYGADGIFLDQMATHAQSYYQAATVYAHAHSLWFVMGNPGVDAPGNAGTDAINFYERGGYPSLKFLSKPSHLQYPRNTWSYIAGAVPFSAAKIRASAAYVGYLYVTNGKEPECYCRLPTYFDRLVASLSTP